LPPRDARLLLEDIRVAIHDIQAFVQAVGSVDEYRSRRMVRYAAERCFTIIGEAMVHLRDEWPETYERIEHGRVIIRFGNVLVHGYFALDQRRVWEVINEELAPLEASIQRLLDELGGES